MSSTPGRHFYDRQIEFLEANDVDGLIANQYADDAIIVGFEFQHRGTEALLTHFRSYLANLGNKVKLISTDKFAETDDSIFFEATVDTAYGTARVYDVFIMNADNKATHHYTGLLSFVPFNS